MARHILVGLGGAIVTLLLTQGAMAADCPAADPATAEAIICGDPSLLAEDRKLADILEATVAASPEEDRAALRDNQEIYFTQRTLACLDAPPPPEQLETVRACVLGETKARQAYLLGTPEAGPGTTGRLVPWVKQGADGSWIWMVHFAKPANMGEVTFNDMVDAVLANVHLAETPDDYADYLNMVVTYADERLISANVDGTDMSPKRIHDMPYNLQINIDLRTGRELTWDDMFERKAVSKLFTECLAQVPEYLALDEMNDGINTRVEDVRIAIDNLRNWRFGGDAARVGFSDYVTDGDWDCVFPYTELRGLTKADFPLPE